MIVKRDMLDKILSKVPESGVLSLCEESTDCKNINHFILELAKYLNVEIQSVTYDDIRTQAFDTMFDGDTIMVFPLRQHEEDLEQKINNEKRDGRLLRRFSRHMHLTIMPQIRKRKERINKETTSAVCVFCTDEGFEFLEE